MIYNNYLCCFRSRRRHKTDKNYFSNPICVPILNTHLSVCQVSREEQALDEEIRNQLLYLKGQNRQERA